MAQRWRDDDRDDRYRDPEEFRGGPGYGRRGYGMDRDYREGSSRDYGRGDDDRWSGSTGPGSFGSGDWTRQGGMSDRFQGSGYGRGEFGDGRQSGRSDMSSGQFRRSGGDDFGGSYNVRSDYDTRSRYNDSYRGNDRGMLERAGDEVASWFGNEDAERRRNMDAQREGRHRGRGPKGYARSDDRIREDVSDRLSDDSTVDASDIEVSVSNLEVTLSGTVDSREARRRAEDCAEAISGVTYVQNNLRVKQAGSSIAGDASSSESSEGTSAFGRSGASASNGSTERTTAR